MRWFQDGFVVISSLVLMAYMISGYVWGGPTALKGMLCKLCPQAPELGPPYPIVDGGLRPVCRPRPTVFSFRSIFLHPLMATSELTSITGIS